MKVFTRDYRITGEYHPLWAGYFGDLRPCVMDIEATGLDRRRCKVVLIGILMPTESGVRITQFLAENHYEEAAVLDAAMDHIERENAGYLITFNGCAYDVPFINARLDACMSGRQLSMYHFDLFRFLQKTTDMKSRLGSMKQTSIEDYYGILSDRGDTISGRESVALFDQYAISRSSTIEKILLTHNREDVLHLNRLMYHVMADIPAEPDAEHAVCGSAAESSGKCGRRAAAFGQDSECGRRALAPDLHRALAVYGFPAAGGRLSARPSIRSVKTDSAVLRITGEQLRDPVSMAFFPDMESPLTVSFNAGTSSYEIECPVRCRGDDLYMDVSFLFDTASQGYRHSEAGSPGPGIMPAASENGSASAEPHNESFAVPPYASSDAPSDVSSYMPPDEPLAGLVSDPDYVNGYLILNSRTINLITRIILDLYM